jgi:hypothetical protein
VSPEPLPEPQQRRGPRSMAKLNKSRNLNKTESAVDVTIAEVADKKTLPAVPNFENKDPNQVIEKEEAAVSSLIHVSS